MAKVDEFRVASEGATATQPKEVPALLDVQQDTGEQVVAVSKATESIEVDSRLTEFYEMYGRWSAVSKSRLDWPRVQDAMLADDGALLERVKEIPKGSEGEDPVMFGADRDGNILFANGGKHAILTGMPFAQTVQKAKELGLILFSCVLHGNYNDEGKKTSDYAQMSEEMHLYQEFTNSDIVEPELDQNEASIWLPKSDLLGLIWVMSYSKYNYSFGVQSKYLSIRTRGVRLMLRAKA